MKYLVKGDNELALFGYWPRRLAALLTITSAPTYDYMLNNVESKIELAGFVKLYQQSAAWYRTSKCVRCL